MTSSPPRANAPAQSQSPVESYRMLPEAYPLPAAQQSNPHGDDGQVQLSSEMQLATVLSDFKEEVFSNISDTALVGDLLAAIVRWTGNDLLLTRLVCHHVMTAADQVAAGYGDELVNKIVQQSILKDWEANDAGAYLRSIRDRLLSYEQRDSLLILYIQILQRGAIAENHTPEQTALLESGLVTLEGGQLQVANAIYAVVFDMDWVEAQLPGITRPVMIVRSQAESAHPSSLSKQYSKVTVLACGLAVLVAASSMYLKETDAPPGEGQQAIATETPAPVAAAAPETDSVPVSNPASADPAMTDPAVTDPTMTDPAMTDRALFDNGVNHATNGRWLPMLRDFCAIPTDSAYFTPAERQIDRWWSLYPEDLLVATETFVAEGNGGCPVVEVSAAEGL
ncbi:MAG: hypothetical protein AAFP03_02680 [Cyanobacteria bacterium J06598_3]